MAAASWSDSGVSPNFNSYATGQTLLWTIVALAVTVCVLLFSWSMWRMRMLRRIEQAKSSCLTLAALVKDPQGRVLATLSETLPSVVIDVGGESKEVRATARGSPDRRHVTL